MKIRRVISAILIPCVLVAGSAAGYRYYQKNRFDKIVVEVTPVSMLAQMDWGSSTSVSGTVNNQARQEIYITTSQKVNDILVKEGERVTPGTAILELDSTQLEIDLEDMRLEIEQQRLDISNGLKRLNRLMNARPYSPGDDYPPIWDDPWDPWDPWFPEETSEEETSEEETTEEESSEEESSSIEEPGTQEESSTEESSSAEETSAQEESSSAEETSPQEESTSIDETATSEESSSAEETSSQEQPTAADGSDLINDVIYEYAQAQRGIGTKEAPYVFQCSPNAKLQLELLDKMNRDGVYAQIWIYNDRGIRNYILDLSLVIVLDENGEIPTEPIETQPIETQPTQTQPVPTQPTQTQPTPTQPVETQPQPTQPIETQPIETQPQPTQPIETQPVETQPQATQPIETIPPQPEPSAEIPVETSASASLWKNETTYLFADMTALDTAANSEKTVGVVSVLQTLRTDAGTDASSQTAQIEIPSVDDESFDYYTAEELKKEIHNQEIKLRDMDLERRKMELQYRIKQNELADTTIKSTVKGVVGEIQDLDDIDYSKPLTVIDGGNGFYLTAQVGELYLDQFQPGDVVYCYGWSENGDVYCEAVITEISEYPSENSYSYYGGNPNVSTYPFTAYIEDGEGLQNGMYMEINIDIAGDMDAFYLDKMYIKQEDGKDYVWAANRETGLLEKRYVRLGKVLWGSYYEIKDGLTQEDAIAQPFGSDIKEGVKTKSTMDSGDDMMRKDGGRIHA